MRDGKGGLVPVNLIKPQHMLEDELVRKVMGYAVALSDQVARFKGHTFEDIGGFEALLVQEYEAKLRGPKGNRTLMSHDALFKVSTLQRMLDARARAPVAVAAPAAASVATGTDAVGGLTGLPYADLAALGLGLVFAVSVAFTYRDAIAAAAHDRFPRFAGWLRSF